MFILSVFIQRPEKPNRVVSRTFEDHEATEATRAFEFYARQAGHNVYLDNVRGQEIISWLQAEQPGHNQA